MGRWLAGQYADAPMSESSEAPQQAGPAVRGAVTCAALVGAACLIMPLLLKSNIWPIAAVFWAVPSVPVAAAVGALVGLATKRLRTGDSRIVLLTTGAALAVVLAVLMANSR